MKSWPISLVLICLISWNAKSVAALPTNDFSSIKQSSIVKNDIQIKEGSIIALNASISLNGHFLQAGTELIVDQNGDLAMVEKDEVVDAGINIRELNSYEYIVLSQDEFTGEILPFSLPLDFEYAGPVVKKTKRGGVTNCYHVVKRLVKDRISLWGVAAYMAAPQLKEAGWHRYADYDSAPEGSVCVFNKGGIPTTSGGHIYGHVGVKGASGVANPTSGFRLKRPFLGCWNEV